MGLQYTLKALADPIRREILNLLKKGRMSAGDFVRGRRIDLGDVLKWEK